MIMTMTMTMIMAMASTTAESIGLNLKMHALINLLAERDYGTAGFQGSASRRRS